MDVGDGIMHFFISQASWENPALFLHHWGKPLFVLLSSPFAQFGFTGMVVFNCVVFTAMVLVGFKILDKKGVSIWLQVLFPLILLSANDLVITTLGGLTEPLFNLAMIVALFFLIEKKYRWFALILSFAPFLRSEGQLPLLLGLILLIFHKDWKNIPFLFIGFILYSIAGYFVYHDAWWYFTKSPYSLSNTIYGKGHWAHYLLSYRNYLGNPGLFVSLLGIFSSCYLLMRRRRKELESESSFFAGALFVGIIAAHSYFWASGQNGSLGLTRITTQGMPLFVVIQLYFVDKLFKENRWLNYVSIAAVGGLLFALVSTKKYPLENKPVDLEVLHAADYVLSMQAKPKHIYFHHPLFCQRFGENPLLQNQRCVFHSFGDLDKDIRERLKPGDFIIWDSHFGPQEMLLPQEKLEKYPDFVLHKEFYTDSEGVSVYRYTPASE